MSPSGKRVRFQYEDVSREYSLRGTVFEFPGVDGAYVMRTGSGPRKYPLKCYFWGPNCDIQATEFEGALLEAGTGKLEHPRYGSVYVVPFGDVGRRDDLKTAANQTCVEVTFFSTFGAIYPTADPHSQNEILATLAGFNLAAANQFAGAMSLRSALNRAAAKSTLRDMLKRVQSEMASVSNAVKSVRKSVQAVQDGINLGMDVLVGAPLLLAQQVSNLIQAPGRALVGLENRLDGYNRLATSIFGSAAGKPGEHIGASSALLSRRQRVANDFHVADLFAANAVAGSVLATSAQPLNDAGQIVRGPLFNTRPQALAAAVALASQMDALVAWRDGAFGALTALPAVGVDQVDTGEAYQSIKQATALAIGRLVQQSFALVPERSITLDRARTIIDVAAEVYGSVDDRLDFLIETNKLTGSEILELPPGRRIVYYAPT